MIMTRNIIVALMLLGINAQASPYFRLIDPAHPKPVAGALLSVSDLKDSAAAAIVPLITHSPHDGCMLPSIVCEDWSPLAVGASVNAGNITIDIGPVANVLPWMQAVAWRVLPDGSLRRLTAPSIIDQPVTFSAGPVWEYRQASNKGYFRIFTGLALHF